MGVQYTPSTDPFINQPRHSPFYIIGFFLFAVPIIIAVVVYQTICGWFGWDQPPPPPPLAKWDFVVISEKTEDSSRKWEEKFWNDTLLSIYNGTWEDNLVATLHGSVDEDERLPDPKRPGFFSKTLNPVPKESPKAPLLPITYKFYKIQSSKTVNGLPSPKYMMVCTYKDKKTASAVYCIGQGPLTIDTVGEWYQKNGWKDCFEPSKVVERNSDYRTLSKPKDMFIDKNGYSPLCTTFRLEDMVQLMRLAEPL